MSWVAIDVDLEDDPRLHAFMALRRWPPDRALAFLFRLLRTVRRQAQDGDVSSWTDVYVGRMTGVARPGGLLADLIAAGLVDEADGRRIVRDWMRTNGSYLRSNRVTEARAAGGRKGGATRAAAGVRDFTGRYVRTVDGVSQESGPDPNHTHQSDQEPEPDMHEPAVPSSELSAEPASAVPAGTAGDKSPPVRHVEPSPEPPVARAADSVVPGSGARPGPVARPSPLTEAEALAERDRQLRELRKKFPNVAGGTP